MLNRVTSCTSTSTCVFSFHGSQGSRRGPRGRGSCCGAEKRRRSGRAIVVGYRSEEDALGGAVAGDPE